MFNQYMDHSSKCTGQYGVLRQEEIAMQQSDTSRFKQKWLDVSGSTGTSSSYTQQQQQPMKPQQQQQLKPPSNGAYYDNRAAKMTSPSPVAMHKPNGSYQPQQQPYGQAMPSHHQQPSYSQQQQQSHYSTSNPAPSLVNTPVNTSNHHYVPSNQPPQQYFPGSSNTQTLNKNPQYTNGGGFDYTCNQQMQGHFQHQSSSPTQTFSSGVQSSQPQSPQVNKLPVSAAAKKFSPPPSSPGFKKNNNGGSLADWQQPQPQRNASTPLSSSDHFGQQAAAVPVNLTATASSSSKSSSASFLSEINIDELLAHYPNVFDELFSAANHPFRLTSIEQIENELRTYCEQQQQQQFASASSAAGVQANPASSTSAAASSAQQFSIRI